MFEFPRIVFLEMQAPPRNSPGAPNIAPLPFLSDSNTNDIAVPLQTKIQRKLDLNVKQNFLEKSACSSRGEGEGIARLQP
jgi:hypothetical protein